MGEFEEHSKEIIEEYSNFLHLISDSLPPVSIKIEALEVIALSKLYIILQILVSMKINLMS